MMMQMVHSRFNALLSACVLSLIATAGWSQSLTWLGVVANDSYAQGVSADGSVVVGWGSYTTYSYGDYYTYRNAFRWTAAGGMQNLGTMGGNQSEAYGVSANGAVVVGRAQNANQQWRAFRWSASSGRMVDLGTLPGGSYSAAYGVSANGYVVVGMSSYYDNVTRGQYERAFRWTVDDGMQHLGTLPRWENSTAYAVSADGAVVVGWAYNYSSRQLRRAFRWQNGVMQDLGHLGGSYSAAYGVSANGAVVVGESLNAAGQWQAFRWQNGVMQALGTLLGGSSSAAYAVSADGSVVVGWAENAAGLERAVRWTASGIEDLNTTYASLLPHGSYLQRATAISPDGRYIVGVGYNAPQNRTQAFLLDTLPRCTLNGDVNGDGKVDDDDLLIVLFNFGNRCR
jgi:probable HAF family extracellular repeat protein